MKSFCIVHSSLSGAVKINKVAKVYICWARIRFIAHHIRMTELNRVVPDTFNMVIIFMVTLVTHCSLAVWRILQTSRMRCLEFCLLFGLFAFKPYHWYHVYKRLGSLKKLNYIVAPGNSGWHFTELTFDVRRSQWMEFYYLTSEMDLNGWDIM